MAALELRGLIGSYVTWRAGDDGPLLVARTHIVVQWRKAWLLRAHEGGSR
jgi:hypothetical protein